VLDRVSCSVQPANVGELAEIPSVAESGHKEVQLLSKFLLGCESKVIRRFVSVRSFAASRRMIPVVRRNSAVCRDSSTARSKRARTETRSRMIVGFEPGCKYSSPEDVRSDGYTNGYTKTSPRPNSRVFTVAPTGIDPVTFRFSVERSTN
jgi:hypothetical protein